MDRCGAGGAGVSARKDGAAALPPGPSSSFLPLLGWGERVKPASPHLCLHTRTCTPVNPEQVQQVRLLESHQGDPPSSLPQPFAPAGTPTPRPPCSKRQGLLTPEERKALCLDPACQEVLGCLPREQEASALCCPSCRPRQPLSRLRSCSRWPQRPSAFQPSPPTRDGRQGLLPRARGPHSPPFTAPQILVFGQASAQPQPSRATSRILPPPSVSQSPAPPSACPPQGTQLAGEGGVDVGCSVDPTLLL